ncbi:hypothetical protein [Salmonella enterica]|uniref:hypothetical protein n=1 Tax=Salmonella enterica TaxID=28901 RepID=UPI0013B06405|nr:hypothetical protein [Salmonella enterica]
MSPKGCRSLIIALLACSFFGVLSPSLYIHGIGVNNLNILHPALRMILLEIIVIVLHLILRWQVAVTGRIE